ncbi:MAG: cobaltochelatase subunit CobN, partial [Cyanobacteria bacterium P01_A01_bin.37]
MHRIAATPGGWTSDTDGVVFIEQSSAPVVVLSAADTDIQILARAIAQLPDDFPSVRVVNILQLQQQLSIDTYAEDVLRHARIIVVRLLGGRGYWPYGVEVIKQLAEDHHVALVFVPGDDRPAPDLISHSTVPLSTVNQVWRYFTEGGLENAMRVLMLLADVGMSTAYHPLPPQSIPSVGLYRPAHWQLPQTGDRPSPSPSRVGILFYRAHYLAGNTAPIDALCDALLTRGIEPLPLYVSSLREPSVQSEVLAYLMSYGQELQAEQPIRVLLNTTSFAIARLNDETLNLDLWTQLDVPVIQVILSGGTFDQWESQWRGLSPRDMAMNVALPEVDGRIISRAVSFKTIQNRSDALETDVVVYEPVGDRIDLVADLATNWARLSETPVSERRIALILANYPNRDGRLANGVGLDTPASCIQILKALQAEDYTVGSLPDDGDALMQQLTQGITNDPEARDYRAVYQSLDASAYQQYFDSLPDSIQNAINQRWGKPLEKAEADRQQAEYPHLPPSTFPIPGIQFGNIFVGIQPSRGYDVDPSLNYHAPDLEPTHEYLAFYYWVRQCFGAKAIAHIGKHGNLEWLPGKSIALSNRCYPEIAFGAMPHVYPFIVNDPGEGAQAKRRAQAVIIDHLTPPMTRAELYGPLQQLEHLIDEYYEAQSLDPTRTPLLRDRIQTLLQKEKLDLDLGLTPSRQESDMGGQVSEAKHQESLNARHQVSTPPTPLRLTAFPSIAPPLQSTPLSIDDTITQVDGYLCELKEAQIRDGLHIFGQCPSGQQLRDLVVAIARHPGPGRVGLTRAIAQSWEIDCDPLTVNPATPIPFALSPFLPLPPLDSTSSLTTSAPTISSPQPCRTFGDLIEHLEHTAAHMVEAIISGSDPQDLSADFTNAHLSKIQNPTSEIPTVLELELHWIQTTLLPALTQTDQEITNLLRSFDGRYVPSGASGAPTRGRADVLPTGRNFYSVDIRAIPTESAWDVGRKAAEVLIERYTQENGEFPKTLGLSVWGTSTMRTGGDDIAEALALLGVQPVWDGASRRVVDFEILPLSVLNRPRVDVTLRVSGFFRDGFTNLIDLFNRAVEAVAGLDESDEWNSLATQTRQDAEQWVQSGLSSEQAEERSRYRVFGSKPGAYGAGLQGLIDAQNWNSDEDLARAYINWSSYAYTGRGDGRSAPEAFEKRLQQMQIVLHNQDNREHDILDSDDYYQFQGGMVAAVRTLQRQQPTTYFGDHSIPENPRVRQLQEEIARVYRSRVVNPKWIAGAMRHGYKGAFEMAATVDYLFAYDATTRCVADHMYEGIANAYVLDDEVQQFVQQKNPWA